VAYARGIKSLNILSACAVILMLGPLIGCAGPTAGLVEDSASRDTSRDAFGSVRHADFSPRFPTSEGQAQESGQSAKPLLFPGSDVAPASPRDQSARTASLEQGDRGGDTSTASIQPAAFVKGGNLQQAPSVSNDGVEINFDGADVQTVQVSARGYSSTQFYGRSARAG